MKSFLQYIAEAVPNRFHGEVFKKFYNMGKRGKFPWPRHRRGGLNDNASDYKMRFPSFQNNKIGRIQTIPITTIPTDLVNNHKGIHLPHENRIDLRQHSSMDDVMTTLGHEAFHSVQTARSEEGENKLLQAFEPNNYGRVRYRRVPNNNRRFGNRNYRDSLGHIRTTNDLEYGDNHNGYPIRDITREVKRLKKLKGKKLGKAKTAHMVYWAGDHEHDARLGGAIVSLAHRAGRVRPPARGRAHIAVDVPLFNYNSFLAAVDPKSRRQERKTRKAFGRIAQAWQDTTGKKINPQHF